MKKNGGEKKIHSFIKLSMKNVVLFSSQYFNSNFLFHKRNFVCESLGGCCISPLSIDGSDNYSSRIQRSSSHPPATDSTALAYIVRETSVACRLWIELNQTRKWTIKRDTVILAPQHSASVALQDAVEAMECCAFMLFGCASKYHHIINYNSFLLSSSSCVMCVCVPFIVRRTAWNVSKDNL